MFRNILFGALICLLLVAACIGQTRDVCITHKPKPNLPSDYGTLDAVTSVIFRVEFLSDGDIGKVAWVKGSHIQRLDELASAVVHRIKFIPKMVDGSPIRTFKMFRYRYSWEYGWSVNGLTCKGTSKDKTQ